MLLQFDYLKINHEQALSETYAVLSCIKIQSIMLLMITLKKTNENLTNVYISEAGLFSRVFLDEALVIYIFSKSRKIPIEEETAVMATNLKRVSFMYILSLAGVLKVI